MALAAPYVNQVGPFSSTSTILYTAPTTGYSRDVVIENAGTAPMFIGSFTAVTAVTGFQVPAGGQVILHGPIATNNIFGITLAAGTVVTVNVGYGSVVSVI